MLAEQQGPAKHASLFVNQVLLGRCPTIPLRVSKALSRSEAELNGRDRDHVAHRTEGVYFLLGTSRERLAALLHSLPPSV